MQTIEMSNSPNYRTNESLQIEGDNVGMHDGKLNLPDYFKSSTNKVADNRASEVLRNKIHNEFSDVLPGIGCLEGTFTLHVKDGS